MNGYCKPGSSKPANGDRNFQDWDLSIPLPKLPVPPLQSTLEKYLCLVKPVLTPQQYAKTKYIVDEFRQPGGLGETLQRHLMHIYETKDNWAYDWWLDDMYMKIRLPLPVNSNPGMVFPRQRFQCQPDQLRYAACLVRGILDYKTIVDSRSIPIERARHKEKGQPMCMEQHYRIFTTYRAPGIKKDVQIIHNGNQDDLDTIIVMCRNQLFALEVSRNSTRPDEDQLFQQLQLIARLAEADSENAPAVGLLTSQSRDKWGEIRIKLQQDEINRESLETIEKSIFILCLDTQTIPSDDYYNDQNDTISMAVHMLHGQGSKANSANRWFDKTMQFVVSEDGTCGLNYEHSVAEGIAVIQLVEHALKYLGNNQQKISTPCRNNCQLSIPRKLCWSLSSSTKDAIASAMESIDRLVDDLSMAILRFDHFGRDFAKSQGMSPDSFIQLALQLTYYKIHNCLVSTYESASVRRFRHGRVDNIRANSPVALEWVKAMVGEVETTDEEKFGFLKQALQWQADNMIETILGNGIDCHLLGLRESAVELSLPTPDIFKDKSYRIANYFLLSTSQVPTTMDSFMCYGPVVLEGYGACYNPHPDYILVCISSFRSCLDTDSGFFALTLESSLLQMKELCLKCNIRTSL